MSCKWLVILATLFRGRPNTLAVNHYPMNILSTQYQLATAILEVGGQMAKKMISECLLDVGKVRKLPNTRLDEQLFGFSTNCGSLESMCMQLLNIMGFKCTKIPV